VSGLWCARSFVDKLRALAADAKKRFPELPYDVEEDIRKYKDIAARVLPFVGDSVEYINTAWEQGVPLALFLCGIRVYG
jgi:adenylosuccinate synthase